MSDIESGKENQAEPHNLRPRPIRTVSKTENSRSRRARNQDSCSTSQIETEGEALDKPTEQFEVGGIRTPERISNKSRSDNDLSSGRHVVFLEDENQAKQRLVSLGKKLRQTFSPTK